MKNTAILLANLGSPDDCKEQPVREYLNEFLMDPYVIQLPWLLRRMIVSLFVLPKRPKQSAAAYQSIWSEDGSPLVAYSEKLRQAVQQKTKQKVFMAMRYGNPSIESQLFEIGKDKSINKVKFIPLYPHYADSTVTTSIKKVESVIKSAQLELSLEVVDPFYNHPDYINALVESSSHYLFERAQAEADDSGANDDMPHLLFSYHGLPESHLVKADPTSNHCMKSSDCCSVQSSAHATCYRHQVFETTRLFVEKSGLKEDQYSVAFQSRLGRAKWLEPSTENKIVELAEKGIKDLLVICPAFVTDCLETLEEIAIRGEEIFIAAGGRSLRLIPCLNEHPDWVNLVASWCNDSKQ